MITAIKSMLERKQLRDELVAKQRLYAQMVKDNVTGPVREKLSREIGQMNVKLCSHANRK